MTEKEIYEGKSREVFMAEKALEFLEREHVGEIWFADGRRSGVAIRRDLRRVRDRLCRLDRLEGRRPRKFPRLRLTEAWDSKVAA